MQNSSKCTFYESVKEDLSFEEYLYLPYDVRTCMARFRMSNHRLPIEVLRYNGVPRFDRLCTLCNNGQLGDEAHYVLQCRYFKSKRMSFLGFEMKSDINEAFLRTLFTNTSHEHCYKLAKFVKYVMKNMPS